MSAWSHSVLALSSEPEGESMKRTGKNYFVNIPSFLVPAVLP